MTQPKTTRGGAVDLGMTKDELKKIKNVAKMFLAETAASMDATWFTNVRVHRDQITILALLAELDKRKK